MHRPARRSQLENFLLYGLLAGLVAGGLLGAYLLPPATWRAGTATTTLGDFALLTLLGLVVYGAWRGAGRRGVAGAAVLAVVALGVREAAWRFAPELLAVLYGAATVCVLVALLGPPAYRLRRGEPAAEILTPERILGILVGGWILGWLLLAVGVGTLRP